MSFLCNVLFSQYITSIASILCVILAIIGIFNFKEYCIISTFLIISIPLNCILIFCFLRTKKDRKLKEKIRQIESTNEGFFDDPNILDALIENATNGIKCTCDSVYITFNKKEKKYYFSFQKEFNIISKIPPSRYMAQFYANKFLTNREQAKKFYSKNIIKWHDLEVKAFIKYKRHGDISWSHEKELHVINQIENGNFIPFDINYQIKDDNSKLILKEDTSVSLRYTYSIPINLWGSYINRSMGFFNGSAIVKISCLNGNEEFQKSVKVVEIQPDGNPSTLDEKSYELTARDIGGNTELKITISGQRCKRYRIKWSSEAYFGKDVDENTTDGVDELNLTAR